MASLKGVIRFEKKEKLSPRFIGPFEVLERIKNVADILVLSPDLASVYNIFHISMLKKYISDLSYILS